MIIRPFPQAGAPPVSYLAYRSFYGIGSYGGPRSFGSFYGPCPAGSKSRNGGAKCCIIASESKSGKEVCCRPDLKDITVVTHPDGKKSLICKNKGTTTPPPGDDDAPPADAPPADTGGGGGSSGGGGGGFFSSDAAGGSFFDDLPWLPIAIGAAVLFIAISATKKKPANGAAGGGGGVTVIAP